MWSPSTICACSPYRGCSDYSTGHRHSHCARTYVQDATGGAEVVFREETKLKLGDEIEVTAMLTGKT